MSRATIKGVDSAQLKRASDMAKLAAEAAAAIEQAGRGLALVHGQCESNAVTMTTIYNLATCLQYGQEAMLALLERQRHENPAPGKLLV